MKPIKLITATLLFSIFAASQVFAYNPPNPNGPTTGANSSPVVPATDWTPNLATGAATSANQSTEVSSLAAIASNGVPVPGVIALTVGTTATPGRSFAVNDTAAGNVAVTFSDGSISTYPVSVGLNVFPFAVTKVNSSGTTATATYENWK